MPDITLYHDNWQSLCEIDVGEPYYDGKWDEWHQRYFWIEMNYLYSDMASLQFGYDHEIVKISSAEPCF